MARRYTGMSQGYVVYPGSKGYMDLSNAKIAARLVANKEGYARVYSVDRDKDVYKVTKKLTNPSVPKGKFIKYKAVKFNKNGSISIKK